MSDAHHPRQSGGLALRRERQLVAVQRLEAALRDGSDQDIVEASEQVRAVGAIAAGVRWDAVYLVEERFRDMTAFREARLSGDEDRIATAWCTLRGRWEEHLSPEDQQVGRAAFQSWGRRLRLQRP